MASANTQSDIREPSIDTDKLSYEIFSILESKFLFGYDDRKLWRADEVVEVQAKNQRGKICILSIDGGGGMRGILSGKALSYLEASLKSKSGNSEAKIADYFDLATGSGVGGIFTAMLFGTKDQNKPIAEADHTWRFLAEQGKRFYRKRKGKANLLRRVLSSSPTSAATSGLEKWTKEVFGGLTLRDTLKPVLIPCYDLSSAAPFVFSRADALEDKDSFDFPLWEVCRATSAEPGWFEPCAMRSTDGQTLRCLAVDGGVATMTNPTAAAITHVLHNKEEFPHVRGVEDILVLSIGTGDVVKVKNWKPKHVARIAAHGSAEMVDQAVSMAFGHYRTTNYVRVQAHGSSMGCCGPNVDTDSSADNVNKLVGLAEEMLKQKSVESVLFGGKKMGEESNIEKLDWFAGELVMEHQRRSCRIAPTVAIKQHIPTNNLN